MEDIGALRDIIGELLESLKGRYWLPAGDVLLDEDISAVLPALANSYELEKERARKMENLTKAEENMQLKDVRIIHIPAAAVASARYFGPDPESHAGRMIADFTRENKLWEKVPDLRMFGFNSPNPPPEGGEYGYEFWVTIPEDMDVHPGDPRGRAGDTPAGPADTGQEKGLTGELRRGIIDVEDKPKNKAGIAEDLMTAGPVII